mmetsp:Transcript_55333/g.103810  ORF Transcript_55333/g.103810 Transcript_55333/m.103810 type:complete len:123 (+) Transcript_55333:90-458(+)
MEIRRSLVSVAVIACCSFSLMGCGCTRDGTGTCAADRLAAMEALCGGDGWPKMVAGEVTKEECCGKMIEVQNCYKENGCSCDTECADEDKAQYCPTTGTLADPIGFYTLALTLIECPQKPGC